MAKAASLLSALGGEAGCRRLSTEFYARVAKDPILRPLFPGKSVRCATEEFSAFLIQFLGGDEEQTQKRWWLSLLESHTRFQINATQRSAWLRHMTDALNAAPLDDKIRAALQEFFVRSSNYVIGKESPHPGHHELAARWEEQRRLDDAIAAIATGQVNEAIALSRHFESRPATFVGLLARMMKSRRIEFVQFAAQAAQRDSSLGTRCFGGRALIHYAVSAGCLAVVATLLENGTNPNLPDSGGHTPLYCVANECGTEVGSQIVKMLVHAGADVNACGGVTRATPLHMAARRGFLSVAQALLDAGANAGARDSKGDTPRRRALNCKKFAVAKILAERNTQSA